MTKFARVSAVSIALAALLAVVLSSAASAVEEAEQARQTHVDDGTTVRGSAGLVVWGDEAASPSCGRSATGAWTPSYALMPRRRRTSSVSSGRSPSLTRKSGIALGGLAAHPTVRAGPEIVRPADRPAQGVSESDRRGRLRRSSGCSRVAFKNAVSSTPTWPTRADPVRVINERGAVLVAALRSAPHPDARRVRLRTRSIETFDATRISHTSPM